MRTEGKERAARWFCSMWGEYIKNIEISEKNIENLVKKLPILLRTEEKERAARWFCPMWGQMIRSLQSLHVWLSGSRGVLCQGPKPIFCMQPVWGLNHVFWILYFPRDCILSTGPQKFRNYRLLSNENKEKLTRWRERCVEDRCPMIVWCCPCPSVICSF